MGLTNAQYDEIMRGYQRRQDLDRQELEERRLEAYGRILVLSEIDEQIAAASTACARAALDHPDQAHEEEMRTLRKKIRQLGVQRTRLLKNAGYDEDYLEPQYQCADCQDTGYIGQEKCHCFRQAELDLFYNQSNLCDELQGEDFSTFSLVYYPENVRDPQTGMTAAETAGRTLQACRRFVEEFDTKFENLFLSGETGLGKTKLSRCIAKALIERMHSVLYFPAYRLFDQLADASFGRTNAEEQDELQRQVFNCDLLIIDDLGTELPNALTLSQFFVCLNERIRHEKSTLISSNLDLQKISETYSERIFSRITSCFTLLHLFGNDIRVQRTI